MSVVCRRCGEELRLIDGDWCDCETHLSCADDGRKHEPSGAAALATERWHEVYDWCREIQKLAQQVSERVDSFANALPDEPQSDPAVATPHETGKADPSRKNELVASSPLTETTKTKKA